LGLAFFGLTSDTILQSRASIFKQIHQIVFHGKGGYDWHTVYNMPIWLRRFTFNEIQKYYDEEKSAHDSQGKSGTQTVIGSDGKVKAPEFLQGAKGNRPAKYK
tara:strand:+ start:753 stop:1061 length:309 start_codon:yes stop_codon:yes gene_type:complete